MALATAGYCSVLTLTYWSYQASYLTEALYQSAACHSYLFKTYISLLIECYDGTCWVVAGPVRSARSREHVRHSAAAFAATGQHPSTHMNAMKPKDSLVVLQCCLRVGCNSTVPWLCCNCSSCASPCMAGPGWLCSSDMDWRLKFVTQFLFWAWSGFFSWSSNRQWVTLSDWASLNYCTVQEKPEQAYSYL